MSVLIRHIVLLFTEFQSLFKLVLDLYMRQSLNATEVNFIMPFLLS